MNSTQSQTSTLPLLPCRPPFPPTPLPSLRGKFKSFWLPKMSANCARNFSPLAQRETNWQLCVYFCVCVCVCNQGNSWRSSCPAAHSGPTNCSISGQKGQWRRGEAGLNSSEHVFCFGRLLACSPNAAKCRCASSLPANCKLSLS